MSIHLTIRLLYSAGFFLATTVYAQQADLAEALQDVTVKEETYEQSFTYDEKNNCLLTFTILDDDEGEETVYQVNAADLNEYKVRFDTKGKAIVVEAETRGGKDVVRVLEDSEVKGFDDGLEFYATSIENARDLVKALKGIVTACNGTNKEV